MERRANTSEVDQRYHPNFKIKPITAAFNPVYPHDLPYPQNSSDPTMVLLSPSSKYNASQLVDCEHPLVSTFIFNYWDNILGPRIKHVWYNGEDLQLDSSTLLQICKQGLASELCRDLTNSTTDWRIHTIPDKGLVAVVFVFSATGSNELSLHSLTLIIQLERLQYFLHLSELIHSWIYRMIGKLRVLLEKDTDSEALSAFTSYLCQFTEMLLSLREAKLALTVRVCDGILSPSHNIEEDFLRTAIASHLMTFGRSVVIGKHVKRINMVINALSLFNSDEERLCSRRVLDESGKMWPYHHDLFLQGLVMDPGSRINSLMKEILSCQYPSTVIDLGMQKVLQSPHHNDHQTYRYEVLKNELICLHYDHPHDTSISNNFIPATDYRESFVRNLLKELRQLPPISSGNLDGVWEAHITNFMRYLQRKAICLIEYIENETNKGSRPLKNGLQKLCLDHELRLEGDLRMVLAVAEKLKPGIYAFVMSDKYRLNEQGQLIE